MSSSATASPAPMLAAIGSVYVTQSLVTGIAMLSMPALLRADGASLQWTGMAALFMLPWGLKFLWAPTVERWRLPAGLRERRSRRLILGGQWLLAAWLLAAALGGLLARNAGVAPQPVSNGLMLALWAAAFLTATIDIACDGFAVDQLASRHRGWGNVAQVGGSYLGIALGGSVFLLLAQARGWPVALAGAGALVALSTLPLLSVADEPGRTAAAATQRPGLRHAFGSTRVRHGLMLTLCCGAGVRLAAGMLTPLLLDRGASLALVGMLNGLLGIGCGLAGTLAGGVLVQRAGAARAVMTAVCLQAVVLLALALAARKAPVSALAVLLGLELAIMACGFVAIYALLMGWASPSQAGVDFTLFQCTDALVAALAGVAGGWLAHRWGYSACFGAASALAGIAAACVVGMLRPMLRASAPSPGLPPTP